MELSVVIPVYNEEGNLEQLNTRIHDVLSKLNLAYEIIYVDDGSKDNTNTILEKFSKLDPKVKTITFSKNNGQTAAFDAGFKAATEKYIITIDADLQNWPENIPLLLSQIPAFDVVCGVRTNRKDTCVKLVSSKIANAVRNMITKETITDTGCSLKIFKKDFINKIPMFEGMHRFLPTLCKLYGATVTEVFVDHSPRVAGVSKYNMFNRVFVSLMDCLAVRWMQKRVLDYRILK